MQKKVIEVKGRQSIALPKLVKALEEAFKDGWFAPEEFLHNDCRMFSQNWFRVVLIKEVEAEESQQDLVDSEPETLLEGGDVAVDPAEGDSEVTNETTEEAVVEETDVATTDEPVVEVPDLPIGESKLKLEQLGKLTKKVELLAFAKENDIEVPTKVKQPAAIAAFLKKALAKK